MTGYLFFDTETTGKPRSWKAPVSQVDNWPRVLQLGMQLYGPDQKLIEEANHLILPPDGGFNIHPEALAVHGISNEMCFEKGIKINEAIDHFKRLLGEAKILLAHNLDFDQKVLGAEFIRIGTKAASRHYSTLCTMKATTAFCGIPGRYGPKWPKLQELHFELFGENFEEAHDALVDVKATAKCYFELLRRGILQEPAPQ